MAPSPLQLPPLYFQEKGCEPAAEDISLPAELFHKCVVDYATWGDLAKLACVQSTWKNTMYDAANSSASKWDLATALLEGTNGLKPNPKRALRLLQQIVSVPVDGETQMPSLGENNAATTDEYASKAMKKLAFMYLEGTAAVADKNTVGMAWLECAFQTGKDVDAAHDIALIYEYGRCNVETDVVAAAQWFEKAAIAGHTEAMAELALCYELGCGVEASDEDAMEWYIKAAEAGHVNAHFSVGEAFEEARGVPKSDEEACLWYYKAAVSGDEDSRKALRRLEDIARIVVPGVRALLDG